MDDLVSTMFAGTLDAASGAIVERARSGLGGYVIQCNLHVLMTAERDPEMMRALTGACHVMPDGAPIAWLQRRRGARDADRIAGPDLMTAVIDAGRNSGLRHLFVGSTDEVRESLVRRISERYPTAEIASVHSSPFGAVDELADAAAAVAGRDADIVWVAFGAPKQELWMSTHAANLAPALVIGVGAAFEYHAGVRRRAPRVLQRHGFEWLYRLVREPRRLVGRYAWTGVAFLRFVSVSLIKRETR